MSTSTPSSAPTPEQDIAGSETTAAQQVSLTSSFLNTDRHSTHYWQAGPHDGPLMIFLHGWPEIALMWRPQIEQFAAAGWRCIAPDMRGYGASAAPAELKAYTHQELVTDMVELHDHLGARPAIWVGHDLGSPVAAALAAHHQDRTAGLVLISVPYLPNSFALPNLLPLINRQIYPQSHYPDGQWDYYRFYLTRFDQSVEDFNADIPSTLAAIYQPGHPNAVDGPSPSASVSANGGWFGPTHRAPPTAPDPTLWPSADFAALAHAFQRNGFRPANAWYLNDDENIAYAHTAPSNGQLSTPTLFVNGEHDPICDINRSELGRHMAHACPDLTFTTLPAGHWIPLERKDALNTAIATWLAGMGIH